MRAEWKSCLGRVTATLFAEGSRISSIGHALPRRALVGVSTLRDLCLGGEGVTRRGDADTGRPLHLSPFCGVCLVISERGRGTGQSLWVFLSGFLRTRRQEH